jgi:hypothetical protein
MLPSYMLIMFNLPPKNEVTQTMEEAKMIPEYRLLCILSVSFIIFTKVGLIRLNRLANPCVVRASQIGFMQGRNIWGGVVILHETVYKLNWKKLNGVILKIDFEKSYHKVKWCFLPRTLRMKSFSKKWRALIHSFVSRGSGDIEVNTSRLRRG